MEKGPLFPWVPCRHGYLVLWALHLHLPEAFYYHVCGRDGGHVLCSNHSTSQPYHLLPEKCQSEEGHEEAVGQDNEAR